MNVRTRRLDWPNMAIPTFSPVCTRCRHLQDGLESWFEASPKSIPTEIWERRYDHTEPNPGDRGIRWEQAPSTALSGYVQQFWLRYLIDQLIDNRRTPVHEAGHAIVAYYHRHTVIRASIVPNPGLFDSDGPWYGVVESDAPWPDDDTPSWPAEWSRIRTRAEILLAGKAAELEILTTSAETREEWVSWGGDMLTLEETLNLSDLSISPRGRSAVIKSAEHRALKIIRDNRFVVDLLADELLELKTIQGHHLTAILRQVKRRRKRDADRRWVIVHDPEFGDTWVPIDHRGPANTT